MAIMIIMGYCMEYELKYSLENGLLYSVKYPVLLLHSSLRGSRAPAATTGTVTAPSASKTTTQRPSLHIFWNMGYVHWFMGKYWFFKIKYLNIPSINPKNMILILWMVAKSCTSWQRLCPILHIQSSQVVHRISQPSTGSIGKWRNTGIYLFNGCLG